MTTHTYREMSVPVRGGALHVGVWEPVGETTDTLIAIHGVTASHRTWPFLVAELPGVRVIAPDLRGRGRSAVLPGPSSMTQHAEDVVALLNAFGLNSAVVLGHSMGAFVSVVLAHQAPERVRRLILVDGGLPLEVPAGLSTDDLVSHILGPTAQRLSMRFDSVADYHDFWRAHPAFRDSWTTELEEYLAYDLIPDGDSWRPATSYETTADDTVDLNAGTAIRDALEALTHQALFVSVPRGLQDDVPGLFAAERVPEMLEHLPTVRHARLDDLNHYTVVMAPHGAAALGALVRAELESS